jgi:hypothetical protein
MRIAPSPRQIALPLRVPRNIQDRRLSAMNRNRFGATRCSPAP